jgi:hypothetical protein
MKFPLSHKLLLIPIVYTIMQVREWHPSFFGQPTLITLQDGRTVLAELLHSSHLPPLRVAPAALKGPGYVCFGDGSVIYPGPKDKLCAFLHHASDTPLPQTSLLATFALDRASLSKRTFVSLPHFSRVILTSFFSHTGSRLRTFRQLLPVLQLPRTLYATSFEHSKP